MRMSPLVTVRYAAMGTVLLFSFITLALAAHLTNTTTTLAGYYYSAAAYSIAIAVISMIVLPIMIVFGFKNPESFMSLAISEIGAIGILCVLWLAAGGVSATRYWLSFGSTCGYRNQTTDTACRETAALTAFGFLNWLILMGYAILLTTFATISAVRGHKGFTQSVMTHNFLAPKAADGDKSDGVLAPQFTGQQPQQPQYVQQPQQPQYGQQPPQQPQYIQQPEPQYLPQPQAAHPGVAQV